MRRLALLAVLTVAACARPVTVGLAFNEPDGITNGGKDALKATISPWSEDFRYPVLFRLVRASEAGRPDGRNRAPVVILAAAAVTTRGLVG